MKNYFLKKKKNFYFFFFFFFCQGTAPLIPVEQRTGEDLVLSQGLTFNVGHMFCKAPVPPCNLETCLLLPDMVKGHLFCYPFRPHSLAQGGLKESSEHNSPE